ncbi:MAG: DUF1573 domain-containing protein [Phycisphaerales bacterium]|nr:DUF1573 domain-containing protein [Phycisphaerales bacterium]
MSNSLTPSRPAALSLGISLLLTATAMAGPRLEISSREWNFGEVWQGEPLAVKVTLKNTGDEPLTLDVKSSCGCTVPTKPKSPLGPGESDVMEIKYDSGHRRGAANQTVTITTNDPVEPAVPFKVIGNVRPIFELKPVDALSFGRVYRNTEETRSIEVLNLYSDAVKVELKPGQSFGAFDVKLEEIEPGRKYQLSAKTRPPLSVGAARTEVVLSTGLTRLPEVRVPVYAAVQPPVAFSPPRLFLPKNSVSEIKQTLRVTYSPDKPVKILAVKPSHDAVKAEIREASRDGKPGGEQTQEILVTLPPGDQVPDQSELALEITTDLTEPEYAKIVIPIRVVSATRADTQQTGVTAPPQPTPERTPAP